ncbi:PA14 domain-containing protein [Calothrix sp. PCC 7716]|nr:PA14 domain-containing protein [Calothrix sp. PCC 7716]
MNNRVSDNNSLTSISSLISPINALNTVDISKTFGQSNRSSSSILTSGAGNGLRGEYYDNIDFTNLKLARVDSTINFNFGSSSPSSLIAPDTFSIRWTGQVEAQYNENYTFYTTSDDGIRLWVNNQLIINNFRDQAATEIASQQVTLEAGKKYDIRLEYYENGGLSVSRLAWSSLSQAKEIIPQSQLYSPAAPVAELKATTTPTVNTSDYTFSVAYADDAAIDVSSLSNGIRVTGANGFNQIATFLGVEPNTNGTFNTANYRILAPGGTWDFADVSGYTVTLEPNQVKDTADNFALSQNLGLVTFSIAGTGTGLKGEYYDNRDFTNLRVTRTDPTVNFNFGSGSPDPLIAPDTFSVRWTGQVEAKFNEEYTFYTTSDDGVRLWINNQLVINNFRDQAATEVASQKILLEAGKKYDIRLDYYENGGLAVSRLAWSSNSQVKQIIPQLQLYVEGVAPTATLNATNIDSAGGNDYTFTVTYSDNVGVNVASFGNTDILVTGPNGFSQLAQYISSSSNTTNGTPRTATYRINAPQTTWSATSNGFYDISLQRSEVSDINGNFAAGANLGRFFVDIAGTGTGLRGEYYDNENFTNLKLTRTDSSVNFNFGGGSPNALIAPDTFSIRWNGRVEPKYTETYTFYATSDDGIRVKVNGTQIISRFFDQPPTESLGTIALEAGQKYDIEIEYYENAGGAVARLEWSSPTQTRQFIPSTQLYLPPILPTIRLGQVPVSVAEGDAIAVVEIERRSEDLNLTSTVKYTTAGDTATENVDFTKVSGEVTFAPGETSKLVLIPIIEDSLPENDETFTFVIDQTTGANLGPQRTVRIAIDDDDRNYLTFSSPIVNEGDGIATVIIKRGLVTGAASVDYITVPGTAQVDSDYQPVTGTLNFAVGERTKTISIPIINDTLGEANETFSLQFGNPVEVTLNGQNSSEITIIDNDPGSFAREVVVGGLTQPTSFDWIPNTNNLLIAQKNGIVRVYRNGELQTTPFVDLNEEVNDVRDRGLLAIAVHPDFQNNPYVYLLYTYDPPETNISNPANNPNSVLDDRDNTGNRPSRLLRLKATTNTNGDIIFDANSTATDNREVLLGKNSNWQFTSRPDGNSTDIKADANGNIDYVANFAPSGIINSSGQLFTNMQDYYNNLNNLTNVEDYLATDSESHSIGYMKFGSDGKLYITNGDGTSYNRVDPRTIRVQDINNLSGKMLRIDSITGNGVSDNPFYDAANPNSNRSKVFNSGLRNPFRFTTNPTTNRPYIGDVGWKTWEEINAGRGQNFGWPYFEGGNGISLQQPEYFSLPPAQAFYNSGQPVTAPIYGYKHTSSNAIVMGDFYTGNTFPSVYQNTLFIADISQGTVDNITIDGNGQFVSIRRFDEFANPNLNSPVQITSGRDGNLYFADIAAGTISRWRPEQST